MVGTTMDEHWTPIPGFDGYELSDWGRVRSWVKPGTGATRRDEPLILKPSKHPRTGHYGYYLSGGRKVSLNELYYIVHPDEDEHILTRELADWQLREIRELEGIKPAPLVAHEFRIAIERVHALWEHDKELI